MFFFQKTVDVLSPRCLLSVAVCVNLHAIIQPLNIVYLDADADVNVQRTDQSDRVITVWPRRNAKVCVSLIRLKKVKHITIVNYETMCFQYSIFTS